MELSSFSDVLRCMNLRTARRTILRQAWLILLAAVIGFCSVYVAVKTVAREPYTSTCTLMVSPKNTTALSNSLSATSNTQIQLTALLQSDIIQGEYQLGQYHATYTVEIPTNGVNIIALTASADTPQLAYEAVHTAVQMAMDSLNTTRVLTIVHQPDIPHFHSFNWKKTGLPGAVGGMLVMLVLLFLLGIGQDCVDTPEAVRLKLNTECLAVLPAGNPAPALRTWDGGFDKSILRLRRRILEETAQDKHIFLFAAAQPGEGCLTTALSVAMALAEWGKKTLLIDADLHHPRALEHLELEATEGDLAHYLMDSSPLDAPVTYTWTDAEGKQQELGILGSGAPCPEAAERLSSPAMRELMDMCRMADAVFLIAPPMHDCSDAEILTSYVDAAILIAAEGCAPVHQLNTAADALERGTKLLGCAFRRLDNPNRRSSHV